MNAPVSPMDAARTRRAAGDAMEKAKRARQAAADTIADAAILNRIVPVELLATYVDLKREESRARRAYQEALERRADLRDRRRDAEEARAAARRNSSGVVDAIGDRIGRAS